ncbi:autoinducer binding domain-containing protein [Peteryoungia desertarenae]|uniref:Autoinducer binding domain-containing protein n=1 Tax=Peteryoungia desertarenae TaxID=1813451 RepID=A0ABX6QQ38_9HYPH|nr:LuxR C-terminal-related transcriptional regulator [Peteryoungia desertarenae]QLF70718.1 autoinducer binding domain-containing protein [Peteryoungia desertarenae]
MTDVGGYFELIDWLNEDPPPSPQAFLNRVKQAYRLNHCLYLDASVKGGHITVQSLHHTLPPRLEDRAKMHGRRAMLEPLRITFEAVEPVDWQEIRRQSAGRSDLNFLVESLGLSLSGACYPLPSREGRHALMAVHSRLPEPDWQEFRRLYDRDLSSIAARFHGKMLRGFVTVERKHSPSERLTPREQETLVWVAAGKSYWETAKILGITERTVRFFMSNARKKLNVVTNTQAVAEAAWRGLIAPASPPETSVHTSEEQ